MLQAAYSVNNKNLLSVKQKQQEEEVSSAPLQLQASAPLHNQHPHSVKQPQPYLDNRYSSSSLWSVCSANSKNQDSALPELLVWLLWRRRVERQRPLVALERPRLKQGLSEPLNQHLVSEGLPLHLQVKHFVHMQLRNHESFDLFTILISNAFLKIYTSSVTN